MLLLLLLIMELENYTVGKSVALKKSSLDMVFAYTNKTKQNFSKTLNIILEEWDELSLIRSKQDTIQQEIKEREQKTLNEADVNKEVALLRNAIRLEEQEELKIESKTKHRRKRPKRKSLKE